MGHRLSAGGDRGIDGARPRPRPVPAHGRRAACQRHRTAGLLTRRRYLARGRRGAVAGRHQERGAGGGGGAGVRSRPGQGLAERRKRAGHLLSKLRFLSAQLVAMLEQGRWLRYAAHANAMADRLAAGLAALPELRLVQPVEANELFVAMPDPWIAALDGQGFAFHRWLAPPGGGPARCPGHEFRH